MMARRATDSSQNDLTTDDIIHALDINVKFARGEKEIREGKGIAHEKARKRLEKWLT